MKRIKIKKQGGKTVIGGEAVIRNLRNLDDGEYAIEIKEWKNNRSLQQNNTLWMWLDIMANELGYRSSEYLYDVFIEQFAPTYTVESLDGKPVQKKLTTSRMNVGQMTAFMEAIDQTAAEFNIKLPRPEEA